MSALKTAELALSPQELDRQWPLVERDGLWFSAPAANPNPYGYMASPSRIGAERMRQAVQSAAKTCRRTKHLIWC